MQDVTHPVLFASKLIGDIVRYHAKVRGEQTALIVDHQQCSYADLDRASNRLANALLAMQLPEQSCVAYLAKESEIYYELLFACAKAGLILVPINWRLKQDEVKHILQDSAAAVLFVGAAQLSQIPELDTVKAIFCLEPQANYPTVANWLDNTSDLDPQVNVTPEHIIALMYTSGTTGLPKGARLKHHGFFEIRQSLVENQLHWLDWQAGELSLIGIPGFHIGGLWWSIQGFSAGVTNVAVSEFNADQVLQLMLRLNINIACVVPAMLNMLLLAIGDRQYDFHALRKIVYGGSPIAESLLTKGIAILQCEFAQIYGLTETGNTAVCLDPQSHLGANRRLTAAGRPYPGVSLKIIDEQGQVLPPFAIGEVCIKTPAHMESYWQLPEATSKTLRQGWIHTGDAGYLDPDGYLFICDRIKDTIIVAGENIYPAEVENAINKHPDIQDAAVIGIPDQQWGEKVIAFLVKKPDKAINAAGMFSFLQHQIADFKIPTKFFFIDTLPRNASGKILRRELRQAFWQDQSRNV